MAQHRKNVIRNSVILSIASIIITSVPVVAFAGAPDPAQTQYFADVLQVVKEQQLDLGDLGQQVLLAIAREVGVWKVVGLLLAFLILGTVGTVWGVLKLFRKAT